MLDIVFVKQNIAFMLSLAFAIAASANFPLLFMSVLWKNCTTRGATVGSFLGLTTAVVLSKSVWVDVFGPADAILPYALPALFSMSAGCAGIWLISILANSERARIDRAGYEAQQMRSKTGIGAITTASY